MSSAPALTARSPSICSISLATLAFSAFLAADEHILVESLAPAMASALTGSRAEIT